MEEMRSWLTFDCPKDLPGILGPLTFSPDTAKPLLRTRGSAAARSEYAEFGGARDDRTYVSSRNDCHFCQLSHGAAAAEHLGGNYDLVDQIKRNFETAAISPQAEGSAGHRRQGAEGRQAGDGRRHRRARRSGATDKEIHDTVLIAAAFCMYNRYVDGLATWQPEDPEIYREIGKQTAQLGYAARDWKRPLQTLTTK